MVALAGGCHGEGEDEPAGAAGKPPASANRAKPSPEERERDAYMRKVRPAFDGVALAERLDRRVVGAESVQEISAALRPVERAFTKINRRLEAVDPPARVVFLHRKLSDVTEDMSVELTSARAGAEQGAPDAAGALGTVTAAYRQQLEDLAGSYERVGYGGLKVPGR